MSQIKTILVTGSQGQLGQSLKTFESQLPRYQFTFSGREELDLSDSKQIADYFQRHQYDLIINCAAYTAVDQAEKEQELANAINYLAVKQLAEIAKNTDTILIHISTDYVFDGTNHQPYVENDTVNPQNIYGSSKLKAEQAIQGIGPQASIIRTSWVYSEFGQNFVKTMTRLGRERDQLNVIFDQIGSPTYARDLAAMIVKMVDSYCTDSTANQHDSVNVYHYSNEGVCSWFDFAQAIFELSSIQCEVAAITSKDYPTPAKRPHYSVLNKTKIKQTFAVTIPYWKASLKTCLSHL